MGTDSRPAVLAHAETDAAVLIDALRAVLDLHRPWYEISGVRYDHTVSVYDPPVEDHVCRVGRDFETCHPADDEHYALACYECRANTEDGEPGFPLWPCATVRAIEKQLGGDV